MAELKAIVHIEKRFYLVIFPISVYEKCGDIEVLKIFGLTVYERAGNLKRFLSCNKLVSTN